MDFVTADPCFFSCGDQRPVISPIKAIQQAVTAQAPWWWNGGGRISDPVLKDFWFRH